VTAALRFGELERAPDLLLDRGRRLAGGLAALGLREGDVVAVLLRNDPVYVDVIHACRTGGFYYCPLNWHFTAHELGYILKDSGARAVIGHADLLAAASEALPDGAPVLAVGGTLAGAVDYEAWLAGQLHYAGPPVSPRGHMAYTSGTTGQPKGVRRDPVPLGEVEAARKRMMAELRHAAGLPRRPAGAALSQRSEHLRPGRDAGRGTLRADPALRRRGDAGADRTPSHRHRLSRADHVCAAPEAA
jgi:long-chain acyl-CoA synthetase